jgi:hypothetical protein
MFGSCPLRSKTLVSPGFFAYRANCFGFPAYPCLSMPAGAASSCALPWPLVSRPVSRKSRLETFVFTGETGDFVVEGVGFELWGDGWKLGDDEGRPNQPVTLSKICLIDKYPLPCALEDG